MSSMHSPSLEPEDPGSANENADPDTQSNELLSQLAAQGGADLQALLAARAAGQSGGDLGLLSLLAAQGSGSGASSGDALQNLALRLLEQQMTPPQPAPDDPDNSPEELELQRLDALERRRERLEQQRQQMTELKQVLKSLYAETETLRARNDALAAALGACYLCFGEDPVCPECGGNGVPGSLPPDVAAFRQYVLPAVRRIRTAQHYRSRDGSAPMRKEENGHHDQPGEQSPTDPTA